MGNRYGLAPMPSAPYAREGQNNVPIRRTVADMRRAMPAGARDFTMFRTGSGRAANAFCHFTLADGTRVARYHDTNILMVGTDGHVRITFGGWHTISTRERFNVAAKELGVPLRAVAIGKRDRTAFGIARSPDAWHVTPNSQLVCPRCEFETGFEALDADEPVTV